MNFKWLTDVEADVIMASVIMDAESVVTVISIDTVEVLNLAFVMEVHMGVN